MHLLIGTLLLWSLILGSVLFLSTASKGSFLRKGFFESSCARLWRIFDNFSKERIKCLATIVIFAIALRLAALPLMHVPEPRSHDEFSYILAGETFASGRVTNPTPPLWQFFETEHQLLVPTYMSKYPPLQGVLVALGILLGNKWLGILLNFGLMCGAIYWMACGFLPTRWALLSALMPLVHPGIASYWVNSYFGGSVAAVGGALTFGASSRLARKIATGNEIWLVLGTAIMANSRPFEGAVTAFVAWSAAAFKLFNSKKLPQLFVPQLVVPALIGLLLAASMLYYNYRVTGDALVLPYVAWHRQYSPIPFWAWSKLNPVPHYNNQQLKDNCDTTDTVVWAGSTTLDSIINWRFVGLMHFFVGVTLMPFAVGSLLSLRDRRMRPLWMAIVAVFIAISITAVGFQRHYAAPVTAPICVLLVQGLRHIRLLKFRGVAVGIAMARVMLIGCVVGVLCGIYSLPSVNKQAQFQQDEFPRLKIMEKLTALPGKQLVVVHYAEGHNPRREYVVNGPDIDNSKVVWARDMGPEKNKELLNHFRDRTVWLFDPDCAPEPHLYTWEEGKTAPLSTKVDNYAWTHMEY